MRVLSMNYSHEKCVKIHFYKQSTSDLNTYEFLVYNTSDSSSQQFTYINTIFWSIEAAQILLQNSFIFLTSWSRYHKS